MIETRQNPPPPATRSEALSRLRAFVPRAGRAYSTGRNYDLSEAGHPHVSLLSPYLRHRLLTEREVLEAVLARHSPRAAEKFIQEVFWRTYWKGWLELRPTVWGTYRRELDQVLAQAATRPDLAETIEDAEAGRTEIDAFNAWARELVDTGYLHNHARMWFASIWIFTLRLPWQVGADFFLRHLLDGDPASNTLSWRWVAGLQTHGKHYLARSANISKYTEGRHNPEWRLNTLAEPLVGPPHPAPVALRDPESVDRGLRTAVLLTEEDLSPGFLLDTVPVATDACAALISVSGRSPRPVASRVHDFTTAAVHDAMTRWSGRLGGTGPVATEIDDIVAWVRTNGLHQVVTPHAPVGPAASRLKALRRALTAENVPLITLMRPWDRRAWPHATHGFFKFKTNIPDLLEDLS